MKQDGEREREGSTVDRDREKLWKGAAGARNLVGVKGQTSPERCAKETTNGLPGKTAPFGANGLIRILCGSGPWKLCQKRWEVPPL